MTMRGSIRILGFAVGVLATIVLSGGTVSAGTAGTVLLADQDGGGDMNIDLAVRQVTVTPVRAHAGDVIHVDVLIENKAEGMRTTNAELLVNGKARCAAALHLGDVRRGATVPVVLRLGHPGDPPRRVPGRGAGLRL